LDLVDAFVRTATGTPSLPAVDDGLRVISYGEIHLRASKIAQLIRQASSGASARVLLALPSSVSAYASMIGTLMAGGTFCPVHVSGPEARNAAICSAFHPDLVLYEHAPPGFLDSMPVTVKRFDLSEESDVRPAEPSASSNEVAYVVFTSGSTGSPKGVRIGRRAFSCFLNVAERYFQGHGERWAQFSNIGHDLGVMDVFMALTQGATLVPLTDGERMRPASAICSKDISIWQSVPSAIDLMMKARELKADFLQSLRLMSFCGEPLYRHQLDALFSANPSLTVFNTYGATETIGFNTLNRLNAVNFASSSEEGSVALGDDVPGWRLMLLGGESVDEGEIAVAGDNLALGYWSDEERTGRSFRLRTNGHSWERIYLTGDRGVRRNGQLYCLGRLDRQIKIRGERIELGDIDAQLRDAGFSGAYTLLIRDELHAFVETSEAVDQERVRAHLSRSLPFHAIPRTIHTIGSLPQNDNGKVDREALSRIVQ
jgi:D-alanine--poly(phosphoribitol) ligase subunit 1